MLQQLEVRSCQSLTEIRSEVVRKRVYAHDMLLLSALMQRWGRCLHLLRG